MTGGIPQAPIKLAVIVGSSAVILTLMIFGFLFRDWPKYRADDTPVFLRGQPDYLLENRTCALPSDFIISLRAAPANENDFSERPANQNVFPRWRAELGLQAPRFN